MNIIDLYSKFNNNSIVQDQLFEEIIQEINPIITNELKAIPHFLRDDMKQEVMLKIFKIFKEQKYKLKLDKLSINNQSLKKFISESKENEKLYQESFLSNEKYNLFINSYIKYAANIKLCAYVKRAIRNCKIDYLKKYYREKFISLNEINDGTEMIDLIEDEKQSKLDYHFLSLLPKDDIAFLKLFLQNNSVLSQSEVAKKMNVSQQYVSKRLKQIIEKIKKL